MIKLRESVFDELKLFVDMSRQPHANRFVLQANLESHQNNFRKGDFHYLTIEAENGEIAGHFILVVDEEKQEIEFGRICLDQNHLGIGQQSIGLMEQYCRENFNCETIWLDVFEDNFRGLHIYEKLGYKKSKQEEFEGRLLLFYKKPL